MGLRTWCKVQLEGLALSQLAIQVPTGARRGEYTGRLLARHCSFQRNWVTVVLGQLWVSLTAAQYTTHICMC